MNTTRHKLNEIILGLSALNDQLGDHVNYPEQPLSDHQAAQCRAAYRALRGCSRQIAKIRETRSVVEQIEDQQNAQNLAALKRSA